MRISGFAKGSDGFALQPREFYLGSLPFHKIPGLADLLLKRMLAAQTGVPPEGASVNFALTAADGARVDPDRVSFVTALRIARRSAGDLPRISFSIPYNWAMRSSASFAIGDRRA